MSIDTPETRPSDADIIGLARDIPVGTVRSRLNRARKQFRQQVPAFLAPHQEISHA